MGWNDTKPSKKEQAIQWLTNQCPFVVKNGDSLTQRLHDEVVSLLKAYPSTMLDCIQGKNASATTELRRDFANFKKAANKENLEKDWALWKSLQKLRVSGNSVKLPDDYIRAAESIMFAAEQLHVHPGPLNHQIGHLKGLLGAAEEIVAHYAQGKKESSLIDYTDMIALAVELITTQKSVFSQLKKQIDCVIVDEFQDTNPLQFSLVWLLSAAGIPTIVVGDMKQAIMGFQGADPRLFESLQKQYKDALNPLVCNWRTQEPLMHFLNDVSAGLFGEQYQLLEPKVEATDLVPIEFVAFNSKRGTGVKEGSWLSSHVVSRIKELLADKKHTIVDPHTGECRSLKASDIAVLAPKHSQLTTYRDVLSSMGLSATISQDGWYESRVVQIVIYALSYLYDVTDKHAALYLSVTELGDLTLEQAMLLYVKGDKPSSPILCHLDQCRESVSGLSMPDVLSKVINALHLYDEILLWPEANQARANLLKLHDVSYDFATTFKETLASGGLYGSGIPTFLAWLTSKIEEDDKQPQASVIDENAVVLKTWHASKGLEWPVVIVAGLGGSFTQNMPDLSIGYHTFDDLDKILDASNIEYSPNFDDPKTVDKFKDRLIEQSIIEAKRLLYVALTRAREKLIFEWPAYKQESDAKIPQYWKILTSSVDMELNEKEIIVNGMTHRCIIHKADGDYADDYDDSKSIMAMGKNYGRIAINKNDYLGTKIPSFSSASVIETNNFDHNPIIQTIGFGQGLNFDIGLSASEYGTLLHRCIELIYEQTLELDQLNLVIETPLELEHISQLNSDTKQLKKAIFELCGESNALFEHPVLGKSNDGTVLTGIIDLLLETEEGYWIVDHKSDRIDNVEEAMTHHLPQLKTYQDILNGYNNKPVLGLAINWVRNGQLTIIKTKLKRNENEMC